MKDETKMVSTKNELHSYMADKPFFQSQIKPNQTGVYSEQDSLYLRSESLINSNYQEESLGDSVKDKSVLYEQRRLKEILLKFGSAMQQFAEGKTNEFIIEKPTWLILGVVAKSWGDRRSRSEKLFLQLRLIDCDLELDKIRETFDVLPSVMLTVNGEKVESQGKLFRLGEYLYEGTDKFMTITSQSRETVYRGEVKGNAMHGFGVFVCRNKENGFKYEGEFVDNHFHGEGTHQTSKNLIYKGSFVNDFKQGQGVERQMKRRKNVGVMGGGFIEKAKYAGSFKQGERDGKGIEETKNYVYDGEWKRGVKSGEGEMRYKNGDRYKGQWANDVFNGKGEYVEKGNAVYSGGFVDGKYEGKGKMQYENGDTYDGYYKAGKKHGQGIYTYADGDYYDGNWVNDSAEGHGTAMIGSDFYDGQFKNGRKHGEGQLTNQEGDILHAVWQYGVVVKKLQWNGQPVEE